MATRPKFTKMANYSCECVECESHFSEMTFGECERMYRVRAKQGGEFGEFSECLSQVVLYTKKDIFMYKTIQSTLAKFTKLAKFTQYSPNLPKRVTKICSILAKFAGASHKNLANFWRVLEFAKFAGEWPLLIKNPFNITQSNIRYSRSY